MTAAAATQAASGAGRHRGVAIVGAVLLFIAAALAVSVDVVPSGYGIKGDEATYVAMALSVAHDGNLSYERRDLERFWGLYRSGPEGLFLKRGSRIRFTWSTRYPWLRTTVSPESETDHLYFGKAFIYPVVAAPFVRILGLNGLLLFHVLLLAAVCTCGYLFLAAGSSTLAAATYATAFVGAAAVPVYAVFLTPEIFNFAMVFFAYFLWLYDPISPGPPNVSRWRMLAAAVLLGLATYSKPTNALLVAAPVLTLWWRRRWRAGAMVGLTAAVTAAACFGVTAAVTGEFNYQGGDRKTFYGTFPFDSPEGTWERRGIGVVTDGTAAEAVLEPATAPARFARNIEYFLVGRHFGFVPYYFPGAMAVVLWLVTGTRRDIWRATTFAGVLASIVVILLVMPYTWSGGGGPPGNRYLLGIYAPLFFLMPPVAATWPGLLTWAVGALFTAKMLVNPFAAAKFPYQTTERGAARRLPVELTMSNDLPIMLDAHRSHLLYGQEPRVLLYLLDTNAWPPEPGIGIWVAGGGRADILVRASQPVAALRMTVESPIQTTFVASAGGAAMTATLTPNTPVSFDLPVKGVRGWRDYSWLLSASSSDGFVPRLFDPNSKDSRNLGALMRFSAIAAAPGS